MELSRSTIERYITERHDDWQWCSEYGEPGYGNADTFVVVMGDYWCRCGHNPHTGRRKTWGDGEIAPTDLHSYSDHHPRFWAAMEAAGVEFEWYDEWTVDYDNDKAYRTTGDSYSWQTSIVWTDDGEFLTPDDDIETWIEWAADDPKRCIPDRVYTVYDLMRAGFEQYNGGYESGWHKGQTDDPTEILATVKRWHPDDTVVFVLTEASQFYIGFHAYHRPPKEDE